MYFDYHVHTSFSFDSLVPMQSYINAAKKIGIEEICFTDHIDIEVPEGESPNIPDFAGMRQTIDRLDKQGITVKFGVEMGMSLCPAFNKQTAEAMLPHEFDFIIASVHMISGEDPWYPAYFDHRSAQQGYADYATAIYDCLLLQPDHFSALGHYDFPIKGCPYSDKEFKYVYAADIMDSIFKRLIQKNKCLELNTSIYRALGRPTGLETLKRYVALGGEFVTIGSDSHDVKFIGAGFRDAYSLAQSAGIKYIATFDKMQPIFHKI